ncbi:uncharacterized protein LOC143034740 [Oratosquilla oratoria]|uniref:uncharacterized protein LOC143034740 n=1 Tax=Oratosquilla oratoria TaxID=337810 RepID=UPI003F7680C5
MSVKLQQPTFLHQPTRVPFPVSSPRPPSHPLPDVNLVAEPKPHQVGRKRANLAKTGSEWEHFYDSYNASAAMGVGGARLTPPLKRARMMLPNTRQQPRAQSPKKVVIPGCEDLKTYSSTGSPDILICGNCRELFSTLSDFIDHKRSYCKLRFTCKCSSFMGNKESASLLCALCKETFASAFDLMVHAQAAHMVNIYQLGSKDSTASSAAESTAGSDVGGDVGGDASTDGGDSNSQVGEDASARTDTPKENGVSDTTEDHEMTDLVNGASPDQPAAADVTAAPPVPVPQEAAAVVTQ